MSVSVCSVFVWCVGYVARPVCRPSKFQRRRAGRVVSLHGPPTKRRRLDIGRAAADGRHTRRAEAVDGRDEVELSGGVEYRVQLEEDTDDSQRMHDTIAALDAGEDDEQLQPDEHQRGDEWRDTRYQPLHSTGADGPPSAAISEYEQLRLRTQHEFESATKQVQRAAASGGVETRVHNSQEAGSRSLWATQSSPSASSPHDALLTAAVTGAAATLSVRSLSTLSNLPLSEWLSSGRPLPLRSAAESAWQRELECQYAESSIEESATEQVVEADVSLADVVVKAASYRQSLGKLAATMRFAAEPQSTAHSKLRSAVHVALGDMQQQYHKVTTAQMPQPACYDDCITLSRCRVDCAVASVCTCCLSNS